LSLPCLRWPGGRTSACDVLGGHICGDMPLLSMAYISTQTVPEMVGLPKHNSFWINRQHIRSTQSSGAKHHPITTSSSCTTPRSRRTPSSPPLRRWHLLPLPLPTATSQALLSMERPTQDPTPYVLPVKLGRSNTDPTYRTGSICPPTRL
jgi:hypothetical protein